MSKHFYNTIKMAGQELATEQAKNIKQEDMVLRVFQWNPNKRYSPSQVLQLVVDRNRINPPITSIRRALTDLTKRGLLIKTEHMVKGLYHLPEHTWVYNMNAS
jgi:Fe2+ or Zn2+ uptake regulation protein